MTLSWMTSPGGQRAAEKNKFKIYAEIETNVITEMCGVKFDDLSLTYKLMYTTVDITNQKFKLLRLHKYK